MTTVAARKTWCTVKTHCVTKRRKVRKSTSPCESRSGSGYVLFAPAVSGNVAHIRSNRASPCFGSVGAPVHPSNCDGLHVVHGSSPLEGRVAVCKAPCRGHAGAVARWARRHQSRRHSRKNALRPRFSMPRHRRHRTWPHFVTETMPASISLEEQTGPQEGGTVSFRRVPTTTMLETSRGAEFIQTAHKALHYITIQC